MVAPLIWGAIAVGSAFGLWGCGEKVKSERCADTTPSAEPKEPEAQFEVTENRTYRYSWETRIVNCNYSTEGARVTACRPDHPEYGQPDAIEQLPNGNFRITKEFAVPPRSYDVYKCDIAGIDPNSENERAITVNGALKLHNAALPPTFDFVVSDNFPYTADQFETIDLQLFSDNPAVVFEWEIISPSNIPGTNEGAVFSDFAFDEVGTYAFKITATLYAADGMNILARDVITRNVTVGPEPVIECFSNPSYGRVEPPTGEILNGSNEELTWTIYDVRDCYGEPLDLANITLDPNSPLYDVNITRDPADSATILVTGKVRPNASGTAIVTIADETGRTNQITLGTPTIHQPQLLLDGDLYLIQVNAGEPLLLQLLNEVPGAVNYEYIIKDIDGETIVGAGHLDTVSNWPDYIPQTNHRTIILQITTEEGSTVEIEKTINVVEPESICYSGPISGTVIHEPSSTQVQGSDAVHEWRVPLNDCYGNPLSLDNVRADLVSYLYDYDEPGMEGNVLIVSGKLRADLNASGAIPVTVDDGDGVGANSTVYLSFSVEEPRLLINGNEFIDQLEPGREYILGLFADVSGASYQYYLQATDGTETVISDPLHFIPARGGRQTIVLRITTGDPAHPVIEVEKEITVTCPIAYDSATVSALDESGRPVSAAYQCISQTEYAIAGLRNQCDDPLSTISLRAQFRDGSPDLVIASLSADNLPVRRVLLAQSPQTTFAFTNARGERVEINWYGQPTVIQGRSGLPTAVTFNVSGEYATSHQYSMMYGETATITADPVISDATYRWRVGVLLLGETGSILSYPLMPLSVPHNYVITLNAEVPITAPDGALCYTQYISGSSQTINVFDPEVFAAIYPEFTSDGQIPRRQVTLNAGILTSVAIGDLTFDWEVTDPDGNPITVGNGQRVNFTPLQSGIYNLTLYIDNAPGSTRLSRQVVKRGQVTIGDFPRPNVEIEGESYPAGGATYPYRSVILPSRWRAFGAEDRNASCRFRVFHNDSSGREVTDSTTTQACVAEGTYPALTYGSIDVPLPSVSAETNYYIELTVTGEDGSYELSEIKTVHVQPATAATASITFTTPYENRIPYRPISFSARPLQSGEYYEWEIVNQVTVAGTEILDPPELLYEGDQIDFELIPSQYFTESGAYAIRQRVYDTNVSAMDETEKESHLIGEVQEDLVIYPFPPAGLEINVNNENPIFAGRTVTIINGLSRAGGLWSEDENASYATTITHDDPDLADPVIDLVSTDSVIRWTPAVSGTYNVASTVTGENGVYRASDAESATVYVPTAAPLALSLIDPPFAAEEDEEVTFNLQSRDPNYTYSFNYDDESTPDASGIHTYTSTGPKTVVVTATNRDNPDIVYYLTHVITIVDQRAPVPNFTLTPGNGPASAATPLFVTINGAGSYSYVGDVRVPPALWRFSVDGGEWQDSSDGTYTTSFTTAGNHSIEMYVVDSNGTASEHITARVPTWAP